ncbi:MAG: hypothetical protein AAF213_00855 [Pseudomonadota bacterium]
MFRSRLKNPDIETVAFEAMGHLKGAFGLLYGQDAAGQRNQFDFSRDQSNRLHRQIKQVLRSQGPSSHPKLTQFLETTAAELAMLDQDFRDDSQAVPAQGWSEAFVSMQTRLGPMVDEVVQGVYDRRLATVAKDLRDGTIEDPSLVERVALVLGARVPNTPLSQPVPQDSVAKPISFTRFLHQPVGQKPTVEAVVLETIGHVKGVFDVDYHPHDSRLFGPKQRRGWQRRIEQALDGDGQLAHPAVKTLLTDTVSALQDLADTGPDYQARVVAAQAHLEPLADQALEAVFTGKLAQVATRFQSGTANRLSKNDRLALALTAGVPKPVAQPQPTPGLKARP